MPHSPAALAEKVTLKAIEVGYRQVRITESIGAFVQHGYSNYSKSFKINPTCFA
jgi:hypothetical protein